MSRVGRTRRTRVYDCNFDKGESYYRPVLDRLDGKVPAPREPDRESIRDDVENRIKTALDDAAATSNDLFDSRGARVQRGRPLSSALEENELAEDTQLGNKNTLVTIATDRESTHIAFLMAREIFDINLTHDTQDSS